MNARNDVSRPVTTKTTADGRRMRIAVWPFGDVARDRHAIEVSVPGRDGRTLSYTVEDVSGDDVALALERVPAPDDGTDGTAVHLAVDRGYGDKPSVAYVRPIRTPDKRDARDRIVVGRMYKLDTFGGVGPVEGPYAPRFKAVAIDETGYWNDEVTAVLGRIKGVYAYDEAIATHLCEVTPSYHLTFLYNAAEAEFPDEETEEAAARAAGFDDWHEFRSSSSDEGQGIYMHCREVDAMPVKVTLDSDEDDVDEYMLCGDPDQAERLHRNLMDEACSEANGPPLEEAFPEGRRDIAPVAPSASPGA